MDVDGGIGGFFNELDAGSLAVGTGDTVGLASVASMTRKMPPLSGEGMVGSSDGVWSFPRWMI